MKTFSTMMFCAALVPGIAYGMDSPPEEPDHDQAAGGQEDRGMGQVGEAGADVETTPDGFLVSLPREGISANNLIGSPVRSQADNEEIGNIEDIILDEDGSPIALIVSVGGFLGMGDREVGISWENANLAPQTDDDDVAAAGTGPGAGPGGGAPGGAGEGRAPESPTDQDDGLDTAPGADEEEDFDQQQQQQQQQQRRQMSPDDDYEVTIDADRDALENAPEIERNGNGW